MRPCLTCGKLTTNSRCEPCDKQAHAHYRGDYARRAKHIRETAIRCHLCGQGYKQDDPWTADHLIPGSTKSPLLPAHRSCNSRKHNRT